MGKNKKYKLLEDDYILVENNGIATTLHRIKALKNFGDVAKGDIGGYIESKRNLSYEDGDDSWVYDDARVYGLAVVRGNSRVRDMAVVRGNSIVDCNSQASDRALIDDSTIINSHVAGNGKAKIFCNLYSSYLCDDSLVAGRVVVKDCVIDGKSTVSQPLSYLPLYIGNRSIFDSIVTGDELGFERNSSLDTESEDNEEYDCNLCRKNHIIIAASLGFIAGIIISIALMALL